VCPATVDYSGRLVSVIVGTDALDPLVTMTQTQQQRSTGQGFEAVGGLLFGPTRTATELLVLVSGFLDLMGVEQRQGAAGGQSSLLLAGSHPFGLGSRSAAQADSAMPQMRLVEVVSP
jgi:hypothetical protein